MADCFLAICDCNEMRPLLRQERARGDLTVEASRPASRNFRGTLGTTSLRGEAVTFDQITVALDQSFAALRAARVFPIANRARKIAGVEVAQAGVLADFDGAQQVFGIRIARDIVLHLVVAVKCG